MALKKVLTSRTSWNVVQYIQGTIIISNYENIENNKLHGIMKTLEVAKLMKLAIVVIQCALLRSSLKMLMLYF